MNNPVKDQYIHQLRIATTYGGFRASTQFVSILFFILAALGGIGGTLLGLYVLTEGRSFERPQGVLFLIGGLFSGLIYLAMGMLLRGVLTAVADIADSITDMNSRYSQPPR